MMDSNGTRRRSSSRAIKRPKFDDELVESSLGSQSSNPLNKMRIRNPSVSTTSECSISLPTVHVTTPEVRKRVPPKRTKRSRKGRKSKSVIKNLGRWKPTDDLALIISVQQSCDLATVHRGTKFSCKFTLGELQERWYALLYDVTVSRVAQQAMKNLHPEQIQAVQANALFRKAEEALLASIVSTSNPTLLTFETLLQENPNIFYRARTAKALLTHWQLMKQYYLLPDQTPEPLHKTELPTSYTEAEKQIHDNELYESSDPLLEHELKLCRRGIRKEIKHAEEVTSRWRVVVDYVMGISPQDFDNETLAVMRGRLVRYLMKSKEISIGRKAVGNQVDVDLSLEGPAWKVSRRQGIIQLRNTGEFYIANEGKRPVFVDGTPVLMGNKYKLINNTIIEISCLRFVFLINEELINNMIGNIKQESSTRITSDT